MWLHQIIGINLNEKDLYNECLVEDSNHAGVNMLHNLLYGGAQSILIKRQVLECRKNSKVPRALDFNTRSYHVYLALSVGQCNESIPPFFEKQP